jgi:hypothetical protein
MDPTFPADAGFICNNASMTAAVLRDTKIFPALEVMCINV